MHIFVLKILIYNSILIHYLSVDQDFITTFLEEIM